MYHDNSDLGILPPPSLVIKSSIIACSISSSRVQSHRRLRAPPIFFVFPPGPESDVKLMDTFPNLPAREEERGREDEELILTSVSLSPKDALEESPPVLFVVENAF